MLKYFNYRTPHVVFGTVILLFSESTSSLSSHPLPATVALKLTKKCSKCNSRNLFTVSSVFQRTLFICINSSLDFDTCTCKHHKAVFVHNLEFFWNPVSVVLLETSSGIHQLLDMG